MLDEALIDVGDSGLERVTNFAVREEDGEAVLTVALSDGQRVEIGLTLKEIESVVNELLVAQQRVLRRLRVEALDRGHRALLDIVDAAERPDQIDVVPDRQTGDRVLLVQYGSRSPMAHRLTLENAIDLQEQLADAKAWASN